MLRLALALTTLSLVGVALAVLQRLEARVPAIWLEAVVALIGAVAMVCWQRVGVRVRPNLRAIIFVCLVGCVAFTAHWCWLWGQRLVEPEWAVPRGWYFAGNVPSTASPFGHFSDNLPRPCAADMGERGRLVLIAYPEERVEQDGHTVLPLRLINRSTQAESFAACGGRLHIVQEAVNRQGRWQALEGLPRPCCPHAMATLPARYRPYCGLPHHVILDSDEYWQFAAPVHQGWFRTRLRLRLVSNDGATLLVSNDYEGAIDPGLFVDRP